MPELAEAGKYAICSAFGIFSLGPKRLSRAIEKIGSKIRTLGKNITSLSKKMSGINFWLHRARLDRVLCGNSDDR